MATSRRTLLLLILSTLFLTSGGAYASQILFFAPQLPCSGVPLTCYPGGVGLPVLWRGPLYVPIVLPANSLIEEIDLWGDMAAPVGIWDALTQPQPPHRTFPGNELAGFGPGDLDPSFTFFATDGINGDPYYELHHRLDNPVLLAEGGPYYVGVNGLAMVGSSGNNFFTTAFSSPANLTSHATLPGVAIRVIGQVVPEPPTLLLILPGAALWRRTRARSRPHD